MELGVCLVFGFEGLMLYMYDLALFDLDGTLTDSGIGIVNSVSFALTHFGIRVNDSRELNRFVGPPLWNSFREFYGFNDEQVSEAIEKYREYYNVKGIFENRLYDGITEILDGLAVSGMKLAVATSKPTKYAKIILEHFEVSHYFDLILGSEMDGTRSDKGEIIGCVLDEMDAGRNMKAVMTGDREHDIVGAIAQNIDSIGVLWGYGDQAELEAAGAIKIISSTNELQHIITGV